MKQVKSFMSGDRYIFDFDICSTEKGFAQVDTKDDFSGHGVWVNPFDLVIVSFAEGDVFITSCNNEQEFIEEMCKLIMFYGSDFIGIDALAHQKLKDRFEQLGFQAFIH